MFYARNFAFCLGIVSFLSLPLVLCAPVLQRLRSLDSQCFSQCLLPHANLTFGDLFCSANKLEEFSACASSCVGGEIASVAAATAAAAMATDGDSDDSSQEIGDVCSNEESTNDDIRREPIAELIESISRFNRDIQVEQRDDSHSSRTSEANNRLLLLLEEEENAQ